VAVAGTFGGLTLGLAGPGANLIAGEVVGHGVAYAASHAALDSTGAVLEHKHDKHSAQKAEQKLQAQYNNFKIQYAQEQAAAQGVPFGGYQPGMKIPQAYTPGAVPGQQEAPAYVTQPPSQDQKYGFVQVPGAPQGPVQYQPPPQDQKYQFVPVPAPYNRSIPYQPQYQPQAIPPPTPAPPYSPPQQVAVDTTSIATVATQPGQHVVSTAAVETTVIKTTSNESPATVSGPLRFASFHHHPFLRYLY
jgi:hypothetical protein